MRKSALLIPALVLSLAACGTATSGGTTTGTASGDSSSSAAVDVPVDVPVDLPAEAPEFSAVPTDFAVGIKVMRKKCFGSAGCNVTYRIAPTYVGDQTLPDTGTIEVTYQVTGGEDGPQINMFTIEGGGSASFDSEEDLSTPSSNTKLKAKATDVSYTP
jgi:hypothetical protein